MVPTREAPEIKMCQLRSELASLRLDIINRPSEKRKPMLLRILSSSDFLLPLIGLFEKSAVEFDNLFPSKNQTEPM